MSAPRSLEGLEVLSVTRAVPLDHRRQLPSREVGRRCYVQPIISAQGWRRHLPGICSVDLDLRTRLRGEEPDDDTRPPLQHLVLAELSADVSSDRAGVFGRSTATEVHVDRLAMVAVQRNCGSANQRVLRPDSAQVFPNAADSRVEPLNVRRLQAFLHGFPTHTS